MSKAFDLFADSYVRNLKRPELFNFSPDQSYGANMVFGSEEQNPWANRNTENAKYGYLGGTQPIKQVANKDASIGINPGLGANAFQPKQSQDVFSKLLSSSMPVISKGSDWAAKSLYDYITTPNNPEVKEATSAALNNLLTGKTPMSGTESAIENVIMGGPTTGAEKVVNQFGDQAVTEGLKESMSSPTGFDPSSMAVAAVPKLAELFGLKADSTTGKGLEAGANVGSAAMQGGMNPIADASAIMSLVNFISSLF